MNYGEDKTNAEKKKDFDQEKYLKDIRRLFSKKSVVRQRKRISQELGKNFKFRSPY